MKKKQLVLLLVISITKIVHGLVLLNKTTVQLISDLITLKLQNLEWSLEMVSIDNLITVY